jgi:hypothetical protein
MKIGITGHRNLGNADTMSWVSSFLGDCVRHQSITMGLTSLAIGADQLYAEILLKFDVPYTAVIPCAAYEMTFGPEELKEYDRLLRRATNNCILSYLHPSEEAFYAAGKYIVENSEGLIAIWDGNPAKGLGGTGDVVKFAKELHVPVLHANPIKRQVRKILP